MGGWTNREAPTYGETASTVLDFLKMNSRWFNFKKSAHNLKNDFFECFKWNKLCKPLFSVKVHNIT